MFCRDHQSSSSVGRSGLLKSLLFYRYLLGHMLSKYSRPRHAKRWFLLWWSTHGAIHRVEYCLTSFNRVRQQLMMLWGIWKRKIIPFAVMKRLMLSCFLQRSRVGPLMLSSLIFPPWKIIWFCHEAQQKIFLKARFPLYCKFLGQVHVTHFQGSLNTFRFQKLDCCYFSLICEQDSKDLYLEDPWLWKISLPEKEVVKMPLLPSYLNINPQVMSHKPLDMPPHA